ncbi:MAG: DUF420 domain-containing protein [Bacteroidetes bacterium]|nr:DUF420 domain-containing protein [Bacteroidota bacterium]
MDELKADKQSGIHGISEQSLSVVIYSLTIVVVALVSFLIYFPQTLSLGKIDVSMLPKLNAFINGTCACLLSIGYIFIRQRKFKQHKTVMLSAFILSCLFLVSYITYHSQAPSTHFGGEGMIKAVYFFILITHIVLAAVIVPLALFTISRSWRGEFAKHKKIARWTLPIWLYVTITGVVVYLMISPYYTH